LTGTDQPVLSVRLPTVEAPQTVHLVLESTDVGTPPLTAFRRVMLVLSPTGLSAP